MSKIYLIKEVDQYDEPGRIYGFFSAKEEAETLLKKMNEFSKFFNAWYHKEYYEFCEETNQLKIKLGESFDVNIYCQKFDETIIPKINEFLNLLPFFYYFPFSPSSEYLSYNRRYNFSSNLEIKECEILSLNPLLAEFSFYEKS